jgi:hypothetical protein
MQRLQYHGGAGQRERVLGASASVCFTRSSKLTRTHASSRAWAPPHAARSGNGACGPDMIAIARQLDIDDSRYERMTRKHAIASGLNIWKAAAPADVTAVAKPRHLR